MVRRLSERVQAVVFLTALALAIAGLYAWVQRTQPPAVATSEVHGVSLLVDGGPWALRYGPVTTVNNTAFGILREAARHLGVPLVWQNYSVPEGVFVVSINGTANGAGGGWQYWVGDVYGNMAADRYPLVDGSNVTWRYTSDQGGVFG